MGIKDTVKGRVEQYNYAPPKIEAGLGTVVKVAGFFVLWTLAVWFVSKAWASWGWEADFEKRKGDAIAAARKEWVADGVKEAEQQQKDRAAEAVRLALDAAQGARAAANIARYVASTKANCQLDAPARAGVAAIFEEANQ